MDVDKKAGFYSNQFIQEKKYWLDKLSGEIIKSSFPYDYKQTNSNVRKDKVRIDISGETFLELNRLTNNSDISLHMVLVAAVICLLYKYNGIEDIVIGTSIYRQDVEGEFLNTVLALRNQVRGDISFKELLMEVRKTVIEAEKNQNYPIEGLIKQLGITDREGDISLFDVVVLLQNIHDSKYIEHISRNVTFLFAKTKSYIGCVLEYNVQLFRKEKMEMITKHLTNILEQVTGNPDIKLKDVDMLTEEEKNTLLFDFNDTQAEYPKDKTIPELFEEQVERTPDNVAVVFGEEQLTYRELNEKANQLARVLRSKGVGPDSIVGIMVERSLEMIIGILGILKAGGAYLPIDPEYPKDRISFILQDSTCNIILTNNNEIIKCLHNDFEILNINEYEHYDKEVSPDLYSHNLAYVMYTSGSTGAPKGVMIEHKSLVNFLFSISEAFQNEIGSCDKCLSLTNISFDVSICEIFFPLIFGGCLVLYHDSRYLEISRVSEILLNEEITFAYIPPTLLASVFEYLRSSTKKVKLNKLLVGVEPIKDNVLSKYGELNKSIKIINGYGPTETTICATFFKYSLNNAVNGSNVSIGKPLNNTHVYIVDKDLNILPVGVPGEICINGDGLARGYLNKPNLTNEKFVPDIHIEGKKMYRTGDLACWRPDGNMEFLGRMDNQVKIRGYRIELGEIESQLLKHLLIMETIVIAKEDLLGDKYLCAYFVSEKELTTTQLREYLSNDLPDYMIPSYFIQLGEMPLTSNGKIDRKALPKPDGRINVGVEYVAPADEVEEKLVLLWQDILGIGRIGTRDNFFDLGGHSLKATNLVSKIHKEFNIEFSLREIFNKPTIFEMANYIKNAGESIYSSIQPVEEQEYYPMSSAQKRLYILDQFESTGIAYNIPGIIIIDGKLDKIRFEESFQELIMRHETLRTSFAIIDGEPVQRVHEEVDFNVTYLESTVDKADEIAKEFIKPFNLNQASLLRVNLVKIKEDKHLMLFDMHHIISDGISMNILINEFISLYEGKKLPELRIQYKDYSAWQKELYNEEFIKNQEDYWLETFKDEIPLLNMPLDYSRPVIQSFEGDHVSFEIGKELTEKFNRIIKDSGATIYMMLLAAFNILLFKYTGQEDIVVGSPIAGRPHVDLQNIIGMFVNTLAMRNYPEGEKTFNEFLNEVKENALKAYENQDYQFEELVEKLDVKRDMGKNPLFDVMFALQNMDISDPKLEGLKFTPYESQFRISKFDVTLNAAETEEGVVFELEYCTKLFKKETMERLIRHYVNILEQVTENPEIRLIDIDMLTEEEKNTILFDFNDTWAEYPKDKTIPELFEEQVEKTPDNVAVVFEDKQLTYRELNEKANQLARVLRDRGVRPNNIVGIMMEHSLEIIVGILGILKAGGAYLPIDPEYPRDRIRFMLEDSNANLLIVKDNLIHEISFCGEILYIYEDALDNGDYYNLDKVNSPRDLVYVIYTSGSTGQPKGIMMEHKALINLCWWHVDYYQVTEADRATKYAGFGFDASVWEIFPYIIAGASIHIVNKDIKLDVYKLNEYFEENNVTISFLPTQICQQFMEIKNTSLRKLLTGGDKLNCYIEQDYELINNYGPTENTVVTTCCKVIGDYDNIPIGKPIYNSKVYIINQYSNLQPVGVPGELCIGGDGLARGYLNNPELTAEKFVDNPFASGEKMYRTGDLARWLPDGNIEFLERIDHQVKIRGFRVELGEIESKLLEHSFIKETVVVTKEDQNDSKYICAYIVCEEELTTTQLREYLSNDLPDYMIPSHFIQLEEMPLTPNGKIDRKALPEPDGSISTGIDYVAPADEVEEKLVLLWQDILGIERIGTRDNFFDLGGHSLKATLLVSRIHKEFNVDFPLKEVFKAPTVSEMAKYIKNAQESIYSSIQPVEEQEYYPMSSAQKRLYILNQFEGIGTAYNILSVIIIEGKLDRVRFEESFQELIRRHETLRTSFTMIKGEPVQRVHEEVDFNVTYLESTEEKAKELAKEFIKPFNLNQTPLLRVCLVKVGEDRHLMLFDMHHIISDGISMNILINEFISLYEGKKLPELRIQYKDYSAWQNKIYTGEFIKDQEDYWLETFKDEIPLLNMPLDYPRPVIQSFEGDRIRFEVGKELTEKLNKTAKDSGATLYMMLLAVFNILLFKYTGQEDIVVGSPIAGRPHVDLQNIIGMFVNTLAMRNYPEGEKTFSEFLNEVMGNALRAYENQDYQFEELVEKLDVKCDLSRNPLFDVAFVLQNMNMVNLEIEGLKFTPYDSGLKRAKLDFNLDGIETGEGIVFNLEYCIKLFKKETMERLVRHYVNILEQVTENPSIKLKDTDILTEEEKKQVLNAAINNLKAGGTDFNF